MKTYRIAALPGDGIGPEIMACALEVLQAASVKFGFTLSVTQGLLGGCAIDATGEPYPEATRTLCKNSDAVLLGAVGGPKWDKGGPRPEQGLLGIRKDLNLYANLRPATVWPSLKDASPLKGDILGDSLDIMIVRELTGGIYFGESGRDERRGQPGAFDVEYYTRDEVRRIARVGFETARRRNKKLTSVDKANVLESSRFWRENMLEVAKDYPDVELLHLYVDNASMQLVRDPKQFDVIVTNNIFGDILSDEASMLTGSIGLLPSASLGNGSLGLYEPIHGSAPDIAGQGIANPLAMILSAAMMLTYSLGEPQAAGAIETAVQSALDSGARTRDLGGNLTTGDMCARVLAHIG